VQYVEIYADDDGVSHFRDIEIELTRGQVAPPALPMELSAFGNGAVPRRMMADELPIRSNKGHASSVAPIFGGIIAAAGIAALPIAGSWQWA